MTIFIKIKKQTVKQVRKETEDIIFIEPASDESGIVIHFSGGENYNLKSLSLSGFMEQAGGR